MEPFDRQLDDAIKEGIDLWRTPGSSHILDEGFLRMNIREQIKRLLANGERNLTEHQKTVEEAAGMPLDWGMANAFEVAAKVPDKLVSVCPRCANTHWCPRDCTAAAVPESATPAPIECICTTAIVDEFCPMSDAWHKAKLSQGAAPPAESAKGGKE